MTRTFLISTLLSLVILVFGCGAPSSEKAESKSEKVAETRAEKVVETRAEKVVETRAEKVVETRAEKKNEPVLKIKVGQQVPSFELDLDDKTLTLDALRKDRKLAKDGTLVLTFWCSHCHSCRVVEKDLDALAEKYRGQVGVIAVDSDAEDTAERIAEFVQKQGLKLPIAIDYDGATAKAFGVRVTTTTLVIDKDGVLRYFGQFKDSKNQYAAEALEAVLDGKTVSVGYTKQKG